MHEIVLKSNIILYSVSNLSLHIMLCLHINILVLSKYTNILGVGIHNYRLFIA